MSKIQFLKKNFLRNFYHLDRPEEWWGKKLRVVTLRACVGWSIGHRPMICVFKTLSTIRKIERTSNHVRTTRKTKTAYPIPKTCSKQTSEPPIQFYFSNLRKYFQKAMSHSLSSWDLLNLLLQVKTILLYHMLSLLPYPYWNDQSWSAYSCL